MFEFQDYDRIKSKSILRGENTKRSSKRVG